MISNALLNPLFGDEKMQQIFSDAAFIEQMVLVERTLAGVQGQLGVIPEAAAATIVAALDTFEPDLPQLQAGVERAGVPVPELVRQLRQYIGGEAASFAHWGATTQDVMDTAVILQIRHALNEIEPALQETITHLARLADAQRHTLMVGRTHSQQALPITWLQSGGLDGPLAAPPAAFARAKAPPVAASVWRRGGHVGGVGGEGNGRTASPRRRPGFARANHHMAHSA